MFVQKCIVKYENHRIFALLRHTMSSLLLPCALGNLSDSVAQVEPGLVLFFMLLTGIDGKTREPFAFYFNFGLKKTEAENYPKANMLRMSFHASVLFSN